MWSTLRSTSFRSMGAIRSSMLTRLPAAVPLLFYPLIFFSSFMSLGKRLPATLSYRLQCQLFSSGSSDCSFLFCVGVAYSRLHACNWLCSFQCRRCCASRPPGRTESRRLALRVGGKPPLTCFHILSCGSISSACVMRTDQCYPRQLRTDAVRGSCGFWTAVPADAGVPTSRCDPLTGGVSSWPT